VNTGKFKRIYLSIILDVWAVLNNAERKYGRLRK
jgi:hypothetical protein